MKKIYFKPTISVYKVKAMSIMAASDPTKVNDEVSTNDDMAKGSDIWIWEEDKEEDGQR